MNATRKLSRTARRMPGMILQLMCGWCQDEVGFEVDEASDELICSACGIHTDFAPDPATTFELLYQAA